MKLFTLQQAPSNPKIEQLLAQMKDIHQPAAVSWWPPAPGWWMLGLLLIGLFAFGIFCLVRLRRQRRTLLYRAEGARLLHDLDLAQPQAMVTINTLLKRVAVVSFGRNSCAQLTGQRWIDFLQRTAPIEMPQLVKTALMESLYSNQLTTDSAASVLRKYAIEWVNLHDCNALNSPHKPQAAEIAGV